METVDIRLRILEAVIPQATRLGMAKPEQIVDIAKVIEEYVNKDYSAKSVVTKKKTTTKKA